MEKKTTRAAGLAAELFVAEQLTAQGYQLLESNYRWQGGEIDLILLSPENILVFVEVRSASRTSPWLRGSVGPEKRRRLQRTIQRFLRDHTGRSAKGIRFDLAWVEQGRLEHWKNVFL